MGECYYCYWIESGSRAYFGATVDPRRRLRQHNSELVGGARKTRGRLWRYKCVVSGFREWKEALQFEWAIKYHSKHCRGVESRMAALTTLLSRERWTSNAPLSSEVPLTLEYDPTHYGLPPETLLAPCQVVAGKKQRRQHRGFKRTLHGVRY